MTNQPQWKLVYSTDDEALYIDEAGQHDPELAISMGYETKRGTTRYRVYRFPLTQMQIVGLYLVPATYDDTWPSPVQDYEEWYADDLDSVAAYSGTTHSELINALCSNDPKMRARAYSDIASYHGADNFDSEPQDWTHSEMADWPERGKPEVEISTNDDDEGFVTLYLRDAEAARDAQSVLGSRWEFDDDLAYACVDDRKDLVEALETEGYKVDSSEWSPPDDSPYGGTH